MTGTWYKILVENQEVYCLELPVGRCVVEDAPDAPQQPETPAVDLTGVLAALERIETAQTKLSGQLDALANKLTAAGAALTE